MFVCFFWGTGSLGQIYALYVRMEIWGDFTPFWFVIKMYIIVLVTMAKNIADQDIRIYQNATNRISYSVQNSRASFSEASSLKLKEVQTKLPLAIRYHKNFTKNTKPGYA